MLTWAWVDLGKGVVLTGEVVAEEGFFDAAVARSVYF